MSLYEIAEPSQDEIDEALKRHELWLRGKEGGLRADFYGANLAGVNLSYANLVGADLRGANLCGTRFSRANLAGASLNGANLASADLTGANLVGANFLGAVLNYADLRGANLCAACFRYARFGGANLDESNFYSAKFARALGINAIFADRTLVTPEGSFYGYKKSKEGHIVKLLIPEDAKRSNGASRKCRCSKALVISITNWDGEEVKTAVSQFDPSFIYEVGKTVEVKDFDEDRWNECAPGIHFFLTKSEAKQWV